MAEAATLVMKAEKLEYLVDAKKLVKRAKHDISDAISLMKRDKESAREVEEAKKKLLGAISELRKL
jgi:hypothetical protein